MTQTPRLENILGIFRYEAACLVCQVKWGHSSKEGAEALAKACAAVGRREHKFKVGEVVLVILKGFYPFRPDVKVRARILARIYQGPGHHPMYTVEILKRLKGPRGWKKGFSFPVVEECIEYPG